MGLLLFIAAVYVWGIYEQAFPTMSVKICLRSTSAVQHCCGSTAAIRTNLLSGLAEGSATIISV